MLLCAELRTPLIKMTDEMPRLLAPRGKFVTLVYSIGNFLSISLQERIDHRDGLVFFTEGSFCGNRAGASVFSEILNVRES
jgi:hypothetical protein